MLFWLHLIVLNWFWRSYRIRANAVVLEHFQFPQCGVYLHFAWSTAWKKYFKVFYTNLWSFFFPLKRLCWKCSLLNTENISIIHIWYTRGQTIKFLFSQLNTRTIKRKIIQRNNLEWLLCVLLHNFIQRANYKVFM